jgi:hypothetical protein
MNYAAAILEALRRGPLDSVELRSRVAAPEEAFLAALGDLSRAGRIRIMANRDLSTVVVGANHP